MEMDSKTKMASLLEIVKEMKKLQGSKEEPEAVAVEIESTELPEELEDEESAEEEHSEMQIPEGLMKLLAEKLGKK